jgi:hypothetical protein
MSIHGTLVITTLVSAYFFHTFLVWRSTRKPPTRSEERRSRSPYSRSKGAGKQTEAGTPARHST